MILKKGGRETQHEAYTRRGQVYARVGSSFIGLLWNSTTVADYAVIDFDFGEDERLFLTDTGRIVTAENPKKTKACDQVKQVPLKASKSRAKK